MNQLLKLDLKTIYSNYQNSNKLELPLPYTNNKPLFINHMLSAFAAVRLKVPAESKEDIVSMSLTLRNIPAEGVQLDGGIMTFENMRALILIAAKVPRSRLISNMTKNPKYATLTPLFMYAHKLYNNVKYSQWDSNDANIDIALGDFLYKALDFQRAYPSIMDIDASTRKHLLGERTWVAYPRFLKYDETMDATEDEAEIISYPKEWLIINCQFWLANAEVRDVDTMLLDMKTWDRIPPALDATAAVTTAEPDMITPENAVW